MESQPLKVYSFAGFTLDAGERILSADGRPLTLAPKIFDTLLFLVENAGRILNKERMLNEIWEGSFVEENNLAQNISALRRLLGETKETKFIETVPKYGYRFVAPVTERSAEEPETEIVETSRARIHISDIGDGGSFDWNDTPTAFETRLPGTRNALRGLVPETHYVQNGDVNIAYQVLGNGPIDIVFVMGWISHLEYFWKHHLFASFLERLASFSRLILFDKRGTGLSDRVPNDKLPTLEQRMEDVHAVMDAVGSQRAVLVGVSEGGPMCSLFAATYPERTSALVMIGTYAKRIKDDDYPWAPSAEQREAFFDLLKRDWGKPVGIEERAPSMANDAEFREWWATYLRMGASPGAAVALTKMNADIDVRNVLPSIRVPTLVIHRKDDKCLKVEEGRYVASSIPGSKYVEFDGDDHLPFVGDQGEILDEIERFVTGDHHSGERDRVLATVMNIRIANWKTESDKRTENEWNELLAQAREIVARKLELFRGREVSYDKSGILATFDGPARAIRCSTAIAEAAREFGLGVKTGLHTGECDVIGDNYTGVAVDLARRITDESINGNILISRTVKDLVAGSGLQFNEFGSRTFDGIEGEWRLFTVNQ
jgi:pimeloyl-ACP methyl ester carboxylesterase/DNA-binding winged helix-turn-helix (wHTH) protein/class 3 adenylate cyclase